MNNQSQKPAPILFGEKENFGIELEPTRRNGNFRMCFWSKGERFGSFKGTWDLTYSILAIKKFRSNYDHYYDPVLDQMTALELDQYLLNDLLEFLSDGGAENMIEYERRKSFTLSFGPQFSHGSLYVLSKQSKVRFVFISENKRTVCDHFVPLDVFNIVCDEFLKFASTVVNN